MAEYLIQDKTLRAIANAIRSKTGSTETIYTKDMATHIYNIEIGSNLKCPILDETYPQSVSINATESASFEVRIIEDGSPNSYTYQWYYNGNAVSGATSKTYIVNTTKNDGGTHLIWCDVTNEAGTVISSTATLTVDDSMYRTPVFTYDGTYALTDDSGTTVAQNTMCDNWKLKFTTGGTITFTKLNSAANGIDVFCVGGGGGSGKGCGDALCSGGGGGGGYTKTVKKVSVNTTSYTITVGSGGSKGSGGGKTSAFSCEAKGGNAGGTANAHNGWNPGGAGGSGGGAGAWNNNLGGAGGTNGGNGGNRGDRTGGTGQGTTTREFGESSGTLYSTGGSGQANANGSGNTGNGGSSKNQSEGTGYSGGSGIVVIRNTRS